MDWFDKLALGSVIVLVVVLSGWFVWVSFEAASLDINRDLFKEPLNVSCLPEYQYYNPDTDIYYCNIDGIIIGV